jgi:hypothetical protein
VTSALLVIAALALAGAAPTPAPSASPSPPAVADPCAGGILATIDRPTVADAACSVAPGTELIEAGYGNQNSRATAGPVTWPFAEFRIGFDGGYELKLFPPNFVRQNSVTGTSDAGLGLKREFGYSQRWITAADAALFLNTGTHGFGAGGSTADVKLIASYALSPVTSLSANIAATSHPNGRGQHFGSFDCTFVIARSLTQRLQAYAELFGTSTDAAGGSGDYAIDGGVQYAPSDSVEFDVEETLQLKPVSGSSARTIGVGAALRL